MFEQAMKDLTITVDEAQRQMLLLALAGLSLQRPGWYLPIGELADVLQGRELYEEFKALQRRQDQAAMNPDETKTKNYRAYDVLIKASLIVASPRLASTELLALAELLADNVPDETLAMMEKRITAMAIAHSERVKAEEGLTPVAQIDLEREKRKK